MTSYLLVLYENISCSKPENHGQAYTWWLWVRKHRYSRVELEQCAKLSHWKRLPMPYARTQLTGYLHKSSVVKIIFRHSCSYHDRTLLILNSMLIFSMYVCLYIYLYFPSCTFPSFYFHKTYFHHEHILMKIVFSLYIVSEVYQW